MNKFFILVLSLISLLFISCTSGNFSEDVKNFETCSQNIQVIGTCIQEHTGYEFNTETDICIKVSVLGCAVEIPFESLHECQSACYTSEKFKDKSLKKIVDDKLEN
jgi:hypothetical protein